MPRRLLLLPAALVVAGGVLVVPAAAAAQAAGVVGRVKVSSGDASIVRQGRTLPAALGTEVVEGDRLRTGADGRLAVMLRDETRLALGPGSELAVTRFAYAPAEAQLGLTLRLARGVLSYVSGLVARLAPGSVAIETPTSIIGVRGTHALVRADAR
ncbi:MAG: FecR domain-containing protein [Vicinamibacterales bacterium]